jgi:hypothetical protein
MGSGYYDYELNICKNVKKTCKGKKYPSITYLWNNDQECYGTNINDIITYYDFSNSTFILQYIAYNSRENKTVENRIEISCNNSTKEQKIELIKESNGAQLVNIFKLETPSVCEVENRWSTPTTNYGYLIFIFAIILGFGILMGVITLLVCLLIRDTSK